MAKVSALYDVIKGDPNSLIGGNIDLNPALAGNQNLGGLPPGASYDRLNWNIGVTVPVGNYRLLASYGKVSDRALDDADASKWALGVRYALSKRTELYADYAQISNDDKSAYTINPMGNSLGLSGVGVKGFAVGMKHSCLSIARTPTSPISARKSTPGPKASGRTHDSHDVRGKRHQEGRADRP